MSWMPKELVAEHATYAGEYVEVFDLELIENGRRVVTLTFGRQTLQLDVERDAVLMEHIAEALLKVLGDVALARKVAVLAAAKAAINAQASAA